MWSRCEHPQRRFLIGKRPEGSRAPDVPPFTSTPMSSPTQWAVTNPKASALVQVEPTSYLNTSSSWFISQTHYFRGAFSLQLTSKGGARRGTRVSQRSNNKTRARTFSFFQLFCLTIGQDFRRKR